MLRLINVEVRYERVTRVLKGLSLEVPEGHIAALLGAFDRSRTRNTWARRGLCVWLLRHGRVMLTA